MKFRAIIIVLSLAFLFWTPAFAAGSSPGEKPAVAIGRTKYKDRLIPVFDQRSVKIETSQPPMYPARFKRDAVDGMATIMIIVDERGKAVGFGLMSSTPDPAFGASAIAAAKQWKYFPKLDVEGKPMIYGIRFKFEFRVTNSP